MKISLIVLCAALAANSGFAQASTSTPRGDSSSEAFAAKIVKKYHSQSDEGSYVAFVVEWNGNEVVVVPKSSLIGDDAKIAVGDTISCTVHRAMGINGQRELRFFYGSEPSEAARLDAIAAEVRRRRLSREASGESPPKGERRVLVKDLVK